LSKIKCFHYHECRHYATECPQNKASRKTLGGARGKALPSQIDLDFTLIAYMSNTVMGSMWYLDSSALFHMTGCRDYFSELEEKDIQMHIKLGDDRRYNTTGIGIVTYHRESGSPLRLKDVMFVLGLKKNIISIAVLEDHGYDMIFNKGKEFLRHIATG